MGSGAGLTTGGRGFARDRVPKTAQWRIGETVCGPGGGPAAGVAELPADAPPATPTPEPTSEPTPEPEAADPDHVHATVVGTVVNLRAGPGTKHVTDGQARSGNVLHVAGRNADGRWLQVEDARDATARVWIYGPLTDIEAATM